tara:strand:+ start:45 stop:1076 length:1032 start_codon:yes stop_codon:yes gene_type:complete
MSIDLLNQLYDKMSVYGDTYGNTQEDIDANQESSDSTGIAPILLPPISSIGSGEGGEENINRNRNINYDNLIVRNQNLDPNIMRIANYNEMFGDKKFTNEIGDFKGDTNLTVASPRKFNFPIDKKSNIFTNAIDKFKSFKDNNKLISGILKAGSFIKDPAMALFTSAMNMLPERDPRQTPLENFYGDNFGLTSSGSVASGIMEGYNPVSMFDGLGLSKAIDERKVDIYNSLTNLGKYNYTATMDPLDLSTWKGANDATRNQLEKLRKLEAIKQGEAEATAAVERARLEKLARQNPGFDPSGPTQRSIREERPDKSGAGQSGGFTNPGKGSYGPHMAKGGIVTL